MRTMVEAFTSMNLPCEKCVSVCVCACVCVGVCVCIWAYNSWQISPAPFFKYKLIESNIPSWLTQADPTGCEAVW